MILTPILGADSTKKSRDIWCSVDRVKAWNDWMLRGQRPPSAASSCKDPLDANVAYANANGIRATPMIIFEDGRRAPGALPVQDLRSQIDRAEAAVKAAAAVPAASPPPAPGPSPFPASAAQGPARKP